MGTKRRRNATKDKKTNSHERKPIETHKNKKKQTKTSKNKEEEKRTLKEKRFSYGLRAFLIDCGRSLWNARVPYGIGASLME